VGDLRLLSYDAREKLFQRITNGDSDASLNAMLLDRDHLLPCGIGWNGGFSSLFPDCIEFIDVDLSDSGETTVVRQRIFSFIQQQDRDRIATSTAPYLIEMFPSLTLPAPLATHLGTIPFESVRIFTLFLANMMQRTYLRSADLKCPFCSLRLSSPHLFSCARLQGDTICDWGRFVRELQQELYSDALDRLFLVLQRYVRGTP
jgi:hypothetical protein